ncbi:hypothetical protein HRW09_35345, partial [Streptomyces lunaelactis]|nr:hypothetical protein [Streptomyces lunaelactis]
VFGAEELQLPGGGPDEDDPGDWLWDASPEGRRAYLNTAGFLTARGQS